MLQRQTRKELADQFPDLFPDRKYNYVEHPPGWNKIILEMCEQLKGTGTVITQTKEKFGTLRVYTAGSEDYEWTIVSEAVHKSTETCQDCGEPGVLRQGSWIKTLCEVHAEGRPEYPIDGMLRF